MNERALLRSLKDGDTGALTEIIGFYTPYLFTIASNVMSTALPREDIEEVVSDSFVALWTHRQELLPGKLKSWLAAVTRNRAKDALRAAHAAEPLDDDLLEIAAPGNMEDHLEQQELLAAIRRLPADFRDAILLHYYQGYGISEIAEMMKVPEGTISSRLSRGRKKLEDLLKESGTR